MKKIVIFFGVPGSGKGTQSKLLAKKFDYYHISTGDLFRRLENDENADVKDKEAAAVIKKGSMAPSWLLYKLAFKEIEKALKEKKGVFLDGAVRSIEQAEEFEKFFEKHNWQKDVLAMVLRLSDEEAFVRLTKRKICSQCGDIITWDKKLESVVKCKKCGGDLIVRTDDNPEAAKIRLELQGNKALEPILNYYKKSGRLAGVDGAKTIKKINKELSFILRHYCLWRLLKRVKKLIKFFRGVK